MDLLIAEAYAQGGQASPGRFLIDILPIIFLFVVFYLVFIRPQTKRSKEHKKMIEALAKGDEVVTNGGLLGRVLELGDNFVLLDVGEGTKVKVQRAAVANTVPKGTTKTL